jgi:hypothetical protein
MNKDLISTQDLVLRRFTHLCKVTALLTTKILEELAEKITYAIKLTLLLKKLPKPSKSKELSVSTMVNPMVEPGKPHLLI